MSVPRAVCIYGLADAEAALAAAVALDVPVILYVRESVAAACGATVAARLFAAARASAPAVNVVTAVDCGDAAGLALSMLREGVGRVRLRGPEPLLARVADIAAQTGAALDHDPLPALDLLGSAQPQRECEIWLRRFKNGCILPHGK